MQIPSLMAKLLRHWAACQINRSFPGITGKRESSDRARSVEMEEGVLQWHSHVCPLPQGQECWSQSSCTFCVWNRCSEILELLLELTLDSLPRGLERLPCKHAACAASLRYFYWINAVFKRLLSVFPREASSSHSSFFVAYRSSRRISRFTISLSHSWGCSFSISVFMLPGWKMRNKYIGTPEQKKPWDGSSAQVWCLTVVVIRGAVLSDITSDAGQDSGWLLWLSLTFWKASVSECLNGALSALQGARCFLMCHLLDCWATCPVILSY